MCSGMDDYPPTAFIQEHTFILKEKVLKINMCKTYTQKANNQTI